MNLSQLVTPLNATLQGENSEFLGISLDTRTLQANNLFFAIDGPKQDGHRFLEQAIAKRAAAVVLSKNIPCELPALRVKDTTLALRDYACWYRQQFTLPVIGLTGSCGKTTTKEMLGAILSRCGRVLTTQGTLNNEYGVPLTLSRLKPDHQYAVIELGANHLEEIAYLTQIVKPDVALITNINPVHLEGFGSLSGVAQGKKEIFQGLSHSGKAIVNKADSNLADLMHTLPPSIECLSFGTKDSDFFAENGKANTRGAYQFTLHTPLGKRHLQLSMIGKHTIQNAVAAAATSYAVGATLDAIQEGLEHATGLGGRLQTTRCKQGSLLINDTYNANPQSVKEAINHLNTLPGKHILVLSDMKELGEHASRYHKEVGEYAKQSGIDCLLTYGELSAFTTQAFGERAKHYTKKPELLDDLRHLLNANTSVLVKGSRFYQMETIVHSLEGG